MVQTFTMAYLPRIVFGNGSLNQLPELLDAYGKHILIITGKRSFVDSSIGQTCLQHLAKSGFLQTVIYLEGEPSIDWIDEVVSNSREDKVDVVVGIGGGSALDAGKVIAALLKVPHSASNYLDNLHSSSFDSSATLPFIAIPTTAGTGTEGTKSAIISVQGENSLKKVFRHEALTPSIALVDPDLLLTCTPKLIAVGGMSAFTQLLEAYISQNANPMTDALALSGLHYIRDNLLDWYHGDENQEAVRSSMAYAALQSGICLEQVGYGLIHHLALSLGALFSIPYSTACVALLLEVTIMNIDLMEQHDFKNPALQRYATLGKLMRGKQHMNDINARMYLIEVLRDWSTRMQIQRLSDYGINLSNIDKVVEYSDMSLLQDMPISLSHTEITTILKRSI